MSDRMKWAVGLGALLLIGLIGIHTNVRGSAVSLEAELLHMAEQRLSEAGENWARVEMQGQRAILTGDAPNQGDIDAAPAGATRTWALATAGIALLVLAGLVLRGMPRAAVAAACMAGLAWQWGARGHVVPQLHALFVSDAISQELEALSLHPRRSAGAKPPLVATGFTEPSLAFLTASTTVLADPRRAAFLIAEQAGRAAVVEDGARTAFERALEEVGADAISLGDVSGFNYSKGRPVTVWIYRTTHEAAPEALTRARAALADEMRP